MKKLFILIFLILTGCGYDAIYSSKKNDFAIISIELNGQNATEKKLARNLNKLTNKKNKDKFYKLNITATKKILITSKDNKGDAKMFNMLITTNIDVFKNSNLVSNISLAKNFSYKNTSNKFDLKQYEKNIEENIINEIIKDINLKLHSI